MKKPDSHMPFYGNDFFQAVKGYGEAFGMRYLKALWHNWSHLDCAGLPDDDGYLREICECPVMEWARTKGVMFGGGGEKFFLLGTDGHWHQKGQDARYAKASRVYESRVETAANARAAKEDADDSSNASSNDSSNSREGLDPKPKPKPYPNSKPVVGGDVSPPSNACDGEWLAVIAKSSAYEGISVQREYDRMVIWCDIHRKKPTKRRLLAWLNRCEKPMTAQPQTKYAGPNL